MKEYRLTRNSSYSNPNCRGHNDLTARQGYYILANSPDEALAEMSARFPDDETGFTVEVMGEVHLLFFAGHSRAKPRR